RLTAALEPECRLRPAADLHLEPEAVDLLLLEYHAGAVPGQEPAEVARLVAAARQAGAPSVVWATGSTGLAWPDDDQLAAADTWFADDPQTATAWSRSAGRAVHPL